MGYTRQPIFIRSTFLCFVLYKGVACSTCNLIENTSQNQFFNRFSFGEMIKKKRTWRFYEIQKIVYRHILEFSSTGNTITKNVVYISGNSKFRTKSGPKNLTDLYGVSENHFVSILLPFMYTVDFKWNQIKNKGPLPQKELNSMFRGLSIVGPQFIKCPCVIILHIPMTNI